MTTEQHTPEPMCPAALPFTITDQEMKDLYRFHECAMDDEGYDVPKERMKRLAEIGLLRRVTANFYEHTVFGLSVINGDFAEFKKRNDDGLREALEEIERHAINPWASIATKALCNQNNNQAAADIKLRAELASAKKQRDELELEIAMLREQLLCRR